MRRRLPPLRPLGFRSGVGALAVVLLAAVSATAVAGVAPRAASGPASAGRVHLGAGVPAYTWPSFHDGNDLSGVSADPAVSTSSAPSLGVHWMANTGAEVLSSPMAAYNAALGTTLVFAGNEAGYMTAFNQSSGLPVWSDDLGSAIRSSPLAEGAYVWIEPSRSYRLYKLDAATGAVVCSAPTPDTENVDSAPMLATPPGGSPTVYIGNNDVGSMNGPLTAVNEATCAIDFQVSPEPVPEAVGSGTPSATGSPPAARASSSSGPRTPTAGSTRSTR